MSIPYLVAMTSYLDKHALFQPLIHHIPEKDLKMVVVIPAYKEPDPLSSLQALYDCDPPHCQVEVLLLINDSAADSSDLVTFHHNQLVTLRQWAEVNPHPKIRFHIHYCSALPKRHAGVGLARKIGMDEACRRLAQVQQPQGIIIAFDADSRCAPNYLCAIESYFQSHPRCPAASIYFEHPLSGVEFEANIYDAIIDYELHLRYFNNAKRYTGFPFAFETVGSAMAVRADAYQQQGGMNRRKAGEDFYFLHKFTPLGEYGEINTTCVIPSPRTSDRVPFGTGRAVGQILEAEGDYQTYALEIFMDLKPLFAAVSSWYEVREGEVEDKLASLPKAVGDFLKQQDFAEKLSELQRNTSSEAAFCQRFFRWFNAFRIMKYVHFARDHYYPEVAVADAAKQLIQLLDNQTDVQGCSSRALLQWYRERDRKGFI